MNENTIIKTEYNRTITKKKKKNVLETANITTKLRTPLHISSSKYDREFIVIIDFYRLCAPIEFLTAI